MVTCYGKRRSSFQTQQWNVFQLDGSFFVRTSINQSINRIEKSKYKQKNRPARQTVYSTLSSEMKANRPLNFHFRSQNPQNKLNKTKRKLQKILTHNCRFQKSLSWFFIFDMRLTNIGVKMQGSRLSALIKLQSVHES